MTFHFAVDTCENFQEYTGSETCVKNEIVEPLMDTFKVQTKVSQQFFSASTYVDEDKQLSSVFKNHVYDLSLDFLSHANYEVSPNEITFENNIVYTDDIFKTETKFNTYEAFQDYSEIYPSSIKKSVNTSIIKGSYLSFTFA